MDAQGYHSLVELLCEKFDADINQMAPYSDKCPRRHGVTSAILFSIHWTRRYAPIHFAVLRGDSEMVQQLSEFGADLEVETKPAGLSPLVLALWLAQDRSTPQYERLALMNVAAVLDDHISRIRRLFKAWRSLPRLRLDMRM